MVIYMCICRFTENTDEKNDPSPDPNPETLD